MKMDDFSWNLGRDYLKLTIDSDTAAVMKKIKCRYCDYTTTLNGDASGLRAMHIDMGYSTGFADDGEEYAIGKIVALCNDCYTPFRKWKMRRWAK